MMSATILVVLLLVSVVVFSIVCIVALLALRRRWSTPEDSQSPNGRPTRSSR